MSDNGTTINLDPEEAVPDEVAEDVFDNHEEEKVTMDCLSPLDVDCHPSLYARRIEGVLV